MAESRATSSTSALGRGPLQIGADGRARFPTPDALSRLAGGRPSTGQSEKHKFVSFGCAADEELLEAVCDWAPDSRLAEGLLRAHVE